MSAKTAANETFAKKSFTAKPACGAVFVLFGRGFQKKTRLLACIGRKTLVDFITQEQRVLLAHTKERKETMKTDQILSNVLDFVLEMGSFSVHVEQTNGRPFNKARDALQDACDDFGFNDLLNAVDSDSEYVHAMLEEWQNDGLDLEATAQALVSALVADFAESKCEADFGGNVGDGASYVVTF